MKKVFLVALAFAVYAAFRKLSQTQPLPTAGKAEVGVDDLAHKLQDAWVDHNTVS